MSKLIVSILAVLMLCTIASARDQFEGKWKVTVTPDEDAQAAGEKEFEDTLVFAKGKFVAEACKEYGFEEVEYEADTRGFTAATFTAEPKSKTEGTAKWTGMTTGQEITGELTWTKKDGTVLHYTYKGSKDE